MSAIGQGRAAAAGARRGKIGLGSGAAGGLPRGRLTGRSTLRGRAVAIATALAVILFGVPAALQLGGPSASVLHAHDFTRQGLMSLPVAAQGPVSAALGSASSGYRIRASGPALEATSAPQHLRSTFTRGGVSVTSGAARVGLALVGVGFGSRTRAVDATAPVVDGNRVTYAHPGVSESYTNGPLGLEQGFTVSRPPAGAGSGPLTLELAVSGNAGASLGGDGRTVSFSRGGEPVLRYAGLLVRDARGRVLPAWLSLRAGEILIHLRASGAAYPLSVDPFLQQGKKLAGEEEAGGSELGTAVAISSDGNTALVGGQGDNSNKGAAWVFTRSGGKWSQQGKKLTGAEEVGEGYFGSSVALSADGDSALIGGEADKGGVGAAWVFTRSEGKWTQQGKKLTGSGAIGEARFGVSVALSEDGATAFIGGPSDHENKGAVWVFTRAGSGFSQQQKLTGEEEAGEGSFGSSVAVAADGSEALIGGPGEQGGIGAAWTFVPTAGKWVQQGKKLTASEESGEAFFGNSVALSADGTTALIAGFTDNTDIGAVWPFIRSGTSWEQQGEKLTGGGEASGLPQFGSSVSLSSDGNVAFVGAANDALGVGAAWAFTRSGGKWKQEGTRLTGGEESSEGRFGASVALSGDGVTAFVGGPGDASVGAGWVFVSPRAPVAVSDPGSEVTESSAVLEGTVTPEGAEAECKFEFGTTVSYGTTVPCSQAPGSGTDPVAVSASLSSLSPNTVYHYRVVATNELGTTVGPDEALTTLLTSVTAKANSPAENAEATDAGVSVKASGGAGQVTVGPYGSNKGGPALLKGSGEYFQVYRSAGSTFTKIEYTDCALGGATNLWWENPETGWEPIAAPVATYNESLKCVTVNATESTRPSVAQLSDPRHVGGPAASEQIGKCEPAKHGHFKDSVCGEEDFTEKNGVRSYKGKYEWLADPVGCFAMKHGRYSEGPAGTCGAEDFSENKKTHEKKYKGKFELGENAFDATGGAAVIKPQGQPQVACAASGETGVMRGANEASVTITLTGCAREAVKCSSKGEGSGVIVGEPVESYGYEEGSERLVVLAGSTILGFTCGSTEFKLGGTLAGQLKASLNTPITSTEASFGEGVGTQEMEMEEVKTQTRHAATLTMQTTTSLEQPVEIKTD